VESVPLGLDLDLPEDLEFLKNMQLNENVNKD
jgi:hypothetical protein